MSDEICPRCDKPRIPDSAWQEAWANADEEQTLGQWRAGVVSKWPGRCDARQVLTCTEPPIDWRARAKDAEAELAEVDVFTGKPLVVVYAPPTYDKDGTNMTPREARTLARALLKFADVADRKAGRKP